MVKFYKDNFNARFTWDWVDGEFITDDTALIENYIGLGLRHEEVKTVNVNPDDAPNEGTIAWIKAELDLKEISYDGITKKADLQELLDLANKPND